MKPELSKPFNLEHAKAGAPYACRNGIEATILKWDGRHPVYPLTGVAGPDDYMTCWTAAGQYEARPLDHKSDLVMLPLGLIDGKPVFVGDEFLWPVSGDLRKASPDMAGGDWSQCSWPAPAREYPRYAGDLDALRHEYNRSMGSTVNGALERVANAALRHAIDADQVAVVESEKVTPHMRKLVADLDKWRHCMSYNDSYFGEPAGLVKRTVREMSHHIDAGQVVVPEPSPETTTETDDPAEVAFWNFDARKKGYADWKDRPQSERDAFKAEYRSGRAALDMAVAEAVRNAAYVGAMNCQSGHEGTVIRQIDLASIIAKIK